MKTLKLFLLIALGIVFSHCGTTEPGTGETTRSILDVHTVLDSTEVLFLRAAALTDGKPDAALRIAAVWLKAYPNVSDAYVLDDRSITIVLTSGLETEFTFDETDDDGNSIYRGGGTVENAEKNEHPVLLSTNNITPLSKNQIKNKKVLIFAAETNTLPYVAPQISKTLTRLVGSGLGLDVTVLRDEQCSYGVVETFGEYGLVIMDTHGSKKGFLVGTTLNFGSLKTEEQIFSALNSQAGAGTADKVASGKLMLSSRIQLSPKKPYWYVSAIPKGERNISFSSDFLDLIPKMPNTIIFGNMCYSGWVASTYTIKAHTDTTNDGRIIVTDEFTRTIRNPIGQAFINREPISYYGYTYLYPEGTSRAVHDDFAAEMEDSLVKRLVEYRDSTKIIHLKPDNITEYHDYPISPKEASLTLAFRHYLKNDYSYQKCGDSLTDSRDGQKYETVCIGTQTWMAENLNYNAPGSVIYNNDPANGVIYGRLYDRNTIMQGASPSSSNPSNVRGICPQGWHLPSEEEFEELEDFIGFANAGGAMKSVTLWDAPNEGATNSSGFSGVPGGFTLDISTVDNFTNAGMTAYYATATVTDGSWKLLNLQHYNGDIEWTHAPLEKWGVSCRCLKD